MEQLLPELTPLLIGSVAFIIGLIIVLAQRKRARLSPARQATGTHSSAA